MAWDFWKRRRPATSAESADSDEQAGEGERLRRDDLVRLVVGGGDGIELLWRRHDGVAALLPPEEAALVERCRRVATLEEHAEALVAELGLDDEERPELAQKLAALAAAGWLVPLPRIAGDAAARPSVISTLGVITRDRPEELERCVRSFAAGLHGGPRVVVADDSADPRRLRERAATLGFQHVGREEKGRLARDLIARGLPDELVRFALLPDEATAPTTGANRNLLLLLAAGEVALFTDDDMVCEAVAPPARGARPEVSFRSRSDPSEMWFFDEEDEVARLPSLAVDLLDAHARVVGQTAAAVIALHAPAAVDLDGSSPAFARRLAAGARVLVAQTGVAGDSGMSASLYQLVGLDGASQERLLASYPRGVTRRSQLRVAPGLTVCEGPHLLGAGLSLDLRQPLLPFLPVGRNADGVFGAALAACHGDACFAHLPLALRHRPREARRYPPVATAGTRLAASDLVMLILEAFQRARPLRPTRSADARVALGRHLVDVATLPAVELDEYLRRLALDHHQSRLRLVAARLAAAEEDDAPEPYRADLAAHHAATVAALPRPDLAHPTDTTLPTFAHRLHLYAELLLAWPDFVAAALALRKV